MRNGRARHLSFSPRMLTVTLFPHSFINLKVPMLTASWIVRASRYYFYIEPQAPSSLSPFLPSPTSLSLPFLLFPFNALHSLHRYGSTVLILRPTLVKSKVLSNCIQAVFRFCPVAIKIEKKRRN